MGMSLLSQIPMCSTQVSAWELSFIYSIFVELDPVADLPADIMGCWSRAVLLELKTMQTKKDGTEETGRQMYSLHCKQVPQLWAISCDTSVLKILACLWCIYMQRERDSDGERGSLEKSMHAFLVSEQSDPNSLLHRLLHGCSLDTMFAELGVQTAACQDHFSKQRTPSLSGVASDSAALVMETGSDWHDKPWASHRADYKLRVFLTALFSFLFLLLLIILWGSVC